MGRYDQTDGDAAPQGSGLGNIAEFALPYRPALRNYFRRRGAHPSIMDDLVQEVFVRLVKRAETAKSETPSHSIENAKGYVMQTASSVWNDHMRHHMRRSQNDHISYEEDAHAVEDFAADRVYEGREAIQRLADILEALPMRTCEVFVLVRIDGMKQKDVAQRLKLSVSAVEKHLMRATAHLAKHFGDAE